MALPSSLHTLGRRTALTGLMSLLSGCTAFGALNTLEPKGGVTVTRDIPYGTAPRQALDVYAPIGTAGGRPVVVFFYGGSWDSGTKADYAWVGQALARQGYVTVVADYRLYPDALWPLFLEDCALAVGWARSHAEAYGGDPARLVVMGHSAGAYNAVELAVDDRWLGSVGLDPHTDIRAVVGLSGPYDFLPLQSDELKTIFGPEAQWPDTQPINHVDGRAAPMLLLTGDRDHTVNPGNTDRMAARITSRGGKAQVIHYPSLDHVRMVGALAAPLRWMAPVMADVTAFIDAQTGFQRG
jgi:acetyl esterase/lipase